MGCCIVLRKSAMLKMDFGRVTHIISALLELAVGNSWLAIASYKAIVDICEANIASEDQFIDHIFPVLAHLRDEEQNADRLYLWLALRKAYPHIEVGDGLEDPLSQTFLSSVVGQLDATAALLPALHPLWTVFAELDTAALLQNAAALWLEQKAHRALISMAVTASVPYMDAPEIVGLVENVALFESALSIPQNEAFRRLLGARFTALIANGDDISIRLLQALLKIDREHSFVTGVVTAGCGQLSDAQIRSLLQTAEPLPFKAVYQLLWAQKHRETIGDFAILSDLFAAAALGARYDDQKLELSKFLAVTLLRKTPDGRTWFGLLSGHEFPSTDAAASLEALVQAANETVVGLNALSTVLRIEPQFEPLAVAVAPFVSYCAALSKGKYEHWHSVSRLLLRKGLTFLEKSHMGVLTRDPELLALAVKSPVLCANALPLFVQNVDKLPKSFWKGYDADERLALPITAADAEAVLPEVMAKCSGKSKLGLQEKVAVALFDMVDGDRGNELVRAHIDAIVKDEQGSVGGSELIAELAKASSGVAFEVLTQVTELAPSVKHHLGIRRMREWIGACCESSEIPVDSIAEAIYATLDQEYGASTSGKKRAEEALSWAQKLMKKVGREIPRDRFGGLAEKFIATGSRNAANIIRQIANIVARE
jgi:hypothetical protein